VKHTPGPWVAFQRDKEKGTNYYRILLHNHPDQQGVYGQDSLCGYCGEANARLIAAAPELLEALKEIAMETTEAWTRWRARAAIAKATGEEP
jgi:hypothetical protein